MIIPNYLNNAVVINQLSSGVPISGVKSGGFGYDLDAFRKAAGFMPYHFFQQANSTIPVTSECNTVVFEHAYQNAQISGRSDIEFAISTAKRKLRDYLGYRVEQKSITREVEFPRPNNPNYQYGISQGVDGNYLTVRAGEGYVKKLGVETFETVLLSAPLVYSDERGDGIKDTATISYPSLNGEISVDQVSCYVPDGLRVDGSTGPVENYKIIPEFVKIDGTELTVKFNSWKMILPKLKESFNPKVHDPNSSEPFLQTIDVYRHYVNPNGTATTTSQVVLIWEGKPHPFCSTSSDIVSSDPAATGTMIARAGIHNSRLGIISIGASVYNESLEEWGGINWGSGYQPDRAIIRFSAGAEYNELDELNKYSSDWDKTLSILTAAELPGHICACAGANKFLDYWSKDIAQIDGNAGQLFRVSESDLANPFGTRLGHIYAWNQVKNNYLSESVII